MVLISCILIGWTSLSFDFRSVSGYFFYGENTHEKMKLLSKITQAVLLLEIFIVPSLSLHFSITGKEAEEYDRKLSEYIREILENFRDQMPEGIPDIGVPPIDPLSIPNIEEDINDGVANMILRMRHINITGISKFDIKLLKADLERGFANFSIAVPELKAEGYCYMNGKILGIFPISSDGPFSIHVMKVSIDGYGDFNVVTGIETSLHMNDLRLNITFGPVDVQFDSLLGGGKWTQVLLKLVTQLGPKIFSHFQDPAMAEINKALLKLINSELDKGTLKDLLDLIPQSLK